MLKTCLAVSALLCAALLVLAARPDFDLDIARLFYVGGHRFIGTSPAGVALRYVFWTLPFVLLAVVILCSGAARLGWLPAGFGLSNRGLALVVGTILLAPGLIVHVTLKEHSHRPRPYSVTEFGGADRFRPFTHFDGACRHDCAFPSGETALATWTLAPASLAPPPWRAAAIAASLLFAAATGGWRMALGGHFMSDVCAAMLISICVVLAWRAIAAASWRVRRPGALRSPGALRGLPSSAGKPEES